MAKVTEQTQRYFQTFVESRNILTAYIFYIQESFQNCLLKFPYCPWAIYIIFFKRVCMDFRKVLQQGWQYGIVCLNSTSSPRALLNAHLCIYCFISIQFLANEPWEAAEGKPDA